VRSRSAIEGWVEAHVRRSGISQTKAALAIPSADAKRSNKVDSRRCLRDCGKPWIVNRTLGRFQFCGLDHHAAGYNQLRDNRPVRIGFDSNVPRIAGVARSDQTIGQ
jgi:hypothetical protein